MTQERNSFTARSVVASLLLGTRPPRLPGAALVRAAAALGCAEGTTRVALSRMVAAGELVAVDGTYELGPALAARQARQEEGRHPVTRPWDGTYVLAIAGGGEARSAASRTALRRVLTELRLAEWREGVWLRPDNLAAGRPSLEGGAWVTGAQLEEPPYLWDVDGWATRARELVRAMSASLDLGDAFALAAAVVRHLRDDPLLPPQLLPRRWPGDQLRERYEGFEAAFRAELRPNLARSAAIDGSLRSRSR